MTKGQEIVMRPILDTFENEDIKEFAIDVIDNFPDYIWEVGASSTGKYHPIYTLGKLGLIKHMISVTRFINFFFNLEQYNCSYTSRQRDLIRLAALCHDGRKSGSQEDYLENKHTKFGHPLIMAKEILAYKNNHKFKNKISNSELVYLATLVAKHMGQWNEQNNLILPKPDDEASKLLHLADYLASRKCISVSFDDLYKMYY